MQLPVPVRRLDAVGARWQLVAAHPRVATTTRSVGLRMGVGVVAVLFAFRYSLLTLVRNLGLDTPLAYLGLVPFIAVGIALALPRPHGELDIQDRQLDYILGLPIVIGVVAAMRTLPHHLSTIYWDDRLDLPFLPLFVFGVSVLLFGLRSSWRYRIPIAFLILAWPLPYTMLIEHAVDASTSLTIKSLAWTMKYIPVATQVPGSDGSLFHIAGTPSGGGSAAQGYNVSIASACAGVNSMVGFGVVGVAFLAVVRAKKGKAHPLVRKTLWLFVGLALVWFLNLARLVLVLGVGKQWGEVVALDGLHPYIGIVVFAVAVAVLMMVMPWFGLTTLVGAPQPVARPVRPMQAQPVLWPPSAWVAAQRALLPARERRRDAVMSRLSLPPKLRGGWRAAGFLVAAGAIVIGITDSTFAQYELTASALGQPRLTSFDEHPATFDGARPSSPDSYDWVKRYFGDSSTWHRYTYYSVGGQPIIADVIDASKLSPFNAYNIEACYAFHGYTFTHQRRVDLGGGVSGYVLQFKEPGQQITYDVTYWVWKVKSNNGSNRYERVVLLRPTVGGTASIVSAQPQQTPFKGLGYNGGEGAPSATSSQDQLVALAKEAVADQPVAPTKTTSGTVAAAGR